MKVGENAGLLDRTVLFQEDSQPSYVRCGENAGLQGRSVHFQAGQPSEGRGGLEAGLQDQVGASKAAPETGFGISTLTLCLVFVKRVSGLRLR